MANHSRIDVSFRPVSYFQAQTAASRILTKVSGTARRDALERAIAEGRLHEAPHVLPKPSLAGQERRAIGALGPRFMGGEYLPVKTDDEVEIARVEIASTTGDVTSVFARQAGHVLQFRVVDEYGGETLTEDSKTTSQRPLTLGELETFFLGAWPLFEVLESNFGTDVVAMLDFFRAPSAFYPTFDRLLRERVRERFATTGSG